MEDLIVMSINAKKIELNKAAGLFGTLIFSAALLSLGACSSFPKTPSKYAADFAGSTGDNTPAILSVFDSDEKILFQSDFKRSVRMATLASPNSQAAGMVYASTLHDIAAAESALKPQIRGGIGLGGQTRGDLQSADGAAMYNFSVQQLLMDGGRTKARSDIAIIRSNVAKAEFASILSEEAKQVSSAWVRVWFAKEHASRVKKRAQFVAESEITLNKLFASGIIDKIDQLSIDNVLEDFDLSKKIANQKVEQAKAAFLSKFDSVPNNLAKPKISIEPLEGLALKEQLLSSPSVQLAVLEVSLAEGSYQLANSELKPTLTSSLGVSPVSTTADYGEANFSAGLNFTHNFSDGGMRKSNLLSTKEKLASRKLALAALSEAAYSRAASAFVDLSMSELKLSRTRKKLDSNEIKVDSIRSQIVTGQSNVRTLIEAEVQGFVLEDELLKVEEEQLLAEIALASDLGLLSVIFDLERE